jgi:regulatory associated protein of mTOR
LLEKFLDIGAWAVNLALNVGIFPYVLRLLQSPAVELRPYLVFIWAKILAVDYVSKHLVENDLVNP